MKTARLGRTSKVVLDTNILVGIIDRVDVLHVSAVALVIGAQASGREVVFLDFLVEEALGVLVRRAKQRKTHPPDLELVVARLRSWQSAGFIVSTSKELAGAFGAILDVVAESAGALNPNDAKIVVLQRSGFIGEIVTLDRALSEFPSLLVFEVAP